MDNFVEVFWHAVPRCETMIRVNYHLVPRLAQIRDRRVLQIALDSCANTGPIPAPNDGIENGSRTHFRVYFKDYGAYVNCTEPSLVE